MTERRGVWYRGGVNYEPSLHVVLYQPEIPHNTGSVGRTCVAVGAKLWLVRPLGFRVDDYYLRRAGLDYWEQLQWEVADDWPDLLRRLGAGRPSDARMWFFTKTAEKNYGDVQFAPHDAFVFGCETQGLPAWLLEQHPGQALRIPTRPEVRSLNLSNAAAVALYEAQRQWGFPGSTPPTSTSPR